MTRRTSLIDRNRRIVETYASGRTLSETAHVHSLSRERIRQILIAEGQPRRSRSHRRMPFSPERAAELYESGLNAADIAARYSLSERAVRRRLHRSGVKIKPGRSHGVRAAHVAERNTQIVLDYEHGFTRTELAEAWQLSVSGISKILVKAGHGGYWPRSKLPWRNSEIRRLRSEGMPYAELSRRFQLTESRLHQIMRAAKEPEARAV